MTLQERQEKFSENLGLLLVWLKVSGYRFKLRELENSLSIDIDLYSSTGTYYTNIGFYESAGKYWESLGMKWNGLRTFKYSEE